jgi:hypothetical protein
MLHVFAVCNFYDIDQCASLGLRNQLASSDAQFIIARVRIYVAYIFLIRAPIFRTMYAAILRCEHNFSMWAQILNVRQKTKTSVNRRSDTSAGKWIYTVHSQRTLGPNDSTLDPSHYLSPTLDRAALVVPCYGGHSAC